MSFDSFIDRKTRSVAKTDYEYMDIALEAAKCAKSKGYPPIGSCLAFPTTYLSEYCTERLHGNPLASAGVNVIRKGLDMLPYKVPNSVLYCTVEPDALTAMAAYKSGIREVVFGVFDFKNGFISSKTRNLDLEVYELKHKGAVLADECWELISEDMKEYCGVEVTDQ